jgi:rRNA maturation RNase YbeY
MAAKVTFHNDGSPYRLPDKRAIRAWVLAAIAAEGFRAGEVAFVFCSRPRHLEINRTYLGHDYPTDVITFDYTDGDVVSGDIFIDPLTIKENAALYNTTPLHEMHRVLIHGILHLCRHDDKTPAQQKTMRQLENKYLSLWNE